MIQLNKPTSFHDYGQASKRLEIIHLRENFPELTLREIGEKVDLTRERVRQILTNANLNTKTMSPRYFLQNIKLKFTFNFFDSHLFYLLILLLYD